MTIAWMASLSLVRCWALTGKTHWTWSMNPDGRIAFVEEAPPRKKRRRLVEIDHFFLAAQGEQIVGVAYHQPQNIIPSTNLSGCGE